MDGRTEVKAKLLADSTVVASVGTYLTKPAIYGQFLVPPKYTGKAISMYNAVPTNGGLELSTYGVTVNCYAKKYSDVETIAEAVFDALNRHSGTNESFFVCSKLPVIPPNETGEDYNSPVEVLVRKK